MPFYIFIKVTCHMPISIFIQLGTCPEAACHLQEMKDLLISISNELLDNFDGLSPEQTKKLRQDRFASYITSM